MGKKERKNRLRYRLLGDVLKKTAANNLRFNLNSVRRFSLARAQLAKVAEEIE